MNSRKFKSWLIENGSSPKVASDQASRLRRLEKELKECDIDEQYRKDKCKELIELLSIRHRKNENNIITDTKLPVNKYYMSAYRLALKKYVLFCDEFISNNQ